MDEGFKEMKFNMTCVKCNKKRVEIGDMGIPLFLCTKCRKESEK